MQMGAISEETKKAFLTIIEELLADTSKKASEITLYTMVDPNRTMTLELFSQNIEEYLYLGIAKRMTHTFTTGLEKSILKFIEVLILSRKGLIISKPAPYSLKFKLENGVEYWMDLKSIKDYPTLLEQEIQENKELAEKNHSEYKLCLYDSDFIYNEAHLLNGSDMWTLVAGFEHAKYEIFNAINGSANNLSISTLIKDTHKRLLNEWRLQD